MHGNEKLGETTIQQKKDETQNKETKPEFLKENTLRVNLLKEIINLNGDVNKLKKINVKAKSDSHGKPENDLPKNKTIEQSKVNKLRVNLLEEIINLNGDVNKLKKHDVKMREDFNDRNENDVLKLAAIERRKFLTDSILI